MQRCRQPLPISPSFPMVPITPISQRENRGTERIRDLSKESFPVPLGRAFPYIIAFPSLGLGCRKQTLLCLYCNSGNDSSIYDGVLQAVLFFCFQFKLLFVCVVDIYYHNKRIHKRLVDCACILNKTLRNSFIHP